MRRKLIVVSCCRCFRLVWRCRPPPRRRRRRPTIARPASPPCGRRRRRQRRKEPLAVHHAARTASSPPRSHWFRDSLEYCRLTTSVYEAALRAAFRQAVRHGPKGWIVFMDADETVLDNSLYERERERCGVGFTQPTWDNWIKAGIAAAIPGAAAFTQTVHALGGLVAIVTNRDVADDPTTRANLKALGIWFDYEIGQQGQGERQDAALARCRRCSRSERRRFTQAGDVAWRPGDRLRHPGCARQHRARHVAARRRRRCRRGATSSSPIRSTATGARTRRTRPVAGQFNACTLTPGPEAPT